jgi:hypothetical protein
MNNLAALGRPDLGSTGGGTGREPTPCVAYGSGFLFLGDKGYMATVQRGEGVHLLPAARWAEYRFPAPVPPRSPGHYRDWFRACKGGDPACSHCGVAGPFAKWVALGASACRFEGKLEYDASKLRCTNNAEANRHLKPVFRKGWDLKL